MAETKIKKVVYLWAILPSVCILAVSAGSIYSNQKDGMPAITIAASSNQIIPKVLGASIQPRGQQPPAITFDESQIDPSQIKAQSFLVFEAQTGDVLLSKNPDEKLAIASLTKLMTGLLAVKNLDFNATATMDSSYKTNISPILNFQPGDEIKIGDLFKAMIVGSENDSALALAGITEKQTGQNFVDLMNGEAQTLGLSQTSYANPVGFDDKDNFSTADDLKTLILETQEYPQFTDLGRQGEFYFTDTDGKEFKVVPTNTLIAKYPELQAIKTGYTDEAQGAMATKLDWKGHELVILVLDSPDREQDTITIMNQLEQAISQ